MSCTADRPVQVFVPDSELPSAPKRRKSLWDEEIQLEAAPTPAAARLTAMKPHAKALVLPEWWDRPPRIPASQAHQDSVGFLCLCPSVLP